MADPVVAPVAPVPGTPEFDASMAALSDQRAADAAAAGTSGALPTTPVPATKPEGVPDKFWNASTGVVDNAGILKAYQELEAKLGGKPPAAPPVPPAAPPAALPDPADSAAAQAAVAAAGLDFDALEAEYAKDGVLSAETYAALTAKGISQETVDSHIEGRRAVAEAAVTAGQALVGGPDKYAQIMLWAKDSLTVQEKVAYNKATNSKDPAVRELAILGMGAKYTRANGSEPATFLGGSGSASQGTAGFASRGEMTAAINDPRFDTDSAYRAQVERRIGLM